MFRITEDKLYDPEHNHATDSNVGRVCEHMPLYGIERVMGNGDAKLPTEGDEIPFRLKDDDGEIYYVGVLNDDPDCENQTAALRWGESDAGCTTIEVKRGETWEQDIG